MTPFDAFRIDHPCAAKELWTRTPSQRSTPTSTPTTCLTEERHQGHLARRTRCEHTRFVRRLQGLEPR
jgi:hypothetical protein